MMNVYYETPVCIFFEATTLARKVINFFSLFNQARISYSAKVGCFSMYAFKARLIKYFTINKRIIMRFEKLRIECPTPTPQRVIVESGV